MTPRTIVIIYSSPALEEEVIGSLTPLLQSKGVHLTSMATESVGELIPVLSHTHAGMHADISAHSSDTAPDIPAVLCPLDLQAAVNRHLGPPAQIVRGNADLRGGGAPPQGNPNA